MKDFNLTNANGYLTAEIRSDGGIGLYFETNLPHNTLMLNKEETLKLASWLMSHVDENIRKA